MVSATTVNMYQRVKLLSYLSYSQPEVVYTSTFHELHNHRGNIPLLLLLWRLLCGKDPEPILEKNFKHTRDTQTGNLLPWAAIQAWIQKVCFLVQGPRPCAPTTLPGGTELDQLLLK